MYKVQFTATVVNPDTEETFNGWVDMEWNRWELRSESTDVRSHEFDTRDEAVEFIKSKLGDVREERNTFYAEDTELHLESGETWGRAAHIE